MVLRIPLLFEGSKNSSQLYALFDSGATYSCINEDIAEEFEIFTPLRNPLKLRTANRQISEVNNAVTLDFYKDGIRMSDEFFVVADLPEEIIIGAVTIRKWKLKQDFYTRTIIVNPIINRKILINLI